MASVATGKLSAICLRIEIKYNEERNVIVIIIIIIINRHL